MNRRRSRTEDWPEWIQLLIAVAVIPVGVVWMLCLFGYFAFCVLRAAWRDPRSAFYIMFRG